VSRCGEDEVATPATAAVFSPHRHTDPTSAGSPGRTGRASVSCRRARSADGRTATV